MGRIDYCTGINATCQHWGIIPAGYHELKHSLTCPLCKIPMSKVMGHPVKEVGYLMKDEVNPELKNDLTP